MNKLQEIMDKYGLTEAQATRFTAQPSRSTTLQSVVSGDREITSINLNLLTTYARALGLKLEDLLADYELDGSTSQVMSMKKYVNRLQKHNDNIKTYSNGGYIISKGIGNKNFKLKRNYDLLNPELNHSTQPTNDIYLLNNQYLNILRDRETDKNKTIAKLTPRNAKRVKSVLIYSPLSAGGDLRLIANSHDKDGNYLFSEIIGCEWIDKEDNKSICYYKAHNDKPFTPEEINRVKKEEISELEFFKCLQSQLPFYNIIL